MREVFEKWVCSTHWYFGYAPGDHKIVERDDDGYADACVHAAWIGYSKGVAIHEDLQSAADDFICKVESGRARSVDSYNKFKAALEKLNG